MWKQCKWLERGERRGTRREQSKGRDGGGRGVSGSRGDSICNSLIVVSWREFLNERVLVIH